MNEDIRLGRVGDALDDTRAIMDEADLASRKMGGMLRGRLRQCAAYDLRALKRELQNFNASSLAWKDDLK